MSDNMQNITEYQNWRQKALIAGVIVGAVVGLGAAYLFVQRAEDPGSRPSFTTGDGVKLGLIVLGLLRQVADLGDRA